MNQQRNGHNRKDADDGAEAVLVVRQLRLFQGCKLDPVEDQFSLFDIRGSKPDGRLFADEVERRGDPAWPSGPFTRKTVHVLDRHYNNLLAARKQDPEREYTYFQTSHAMDWGISCPLRRLELAIGTRPSQKMGKDYARIDGEFWDVSVKLWDDEGRLP